MLEVPLPTNPLIITYMILQDLVEDSLYREHRGGGDGDFLTIWISDWGSLRESEVTWDDFLLVDMEGLWFLFSLYLWLLSLSQYIFFFVLLFPDSFALLEFPFTNFWSHPLWIRS